MKIPDNNGLIKKTDYNGKITKIEGKILTITGLVLTTGFNEVEIKIISFSDLVKKHIL